jgi:hypothetical protein
MQYSLTQKWAWIGVIGAALVACSGSSPGTGPGTDPGSQPPAGNGPNGPGAGADGGINDSGARAPGSDAGSPGQPSADGTPMRQTCTTAFGSALTSNFGRLDGYLVAIVAAGHHGCNSDQDHLHLQVSAAGAVYDVAVTLVSTQSTGMPEVFLAEKDAPLGNGPWAEGWHSGTERFDYVSNLGLHASDFTATPAAALATKLEGSLGTVNHISIYATGYGPTGAHKVHRNGFGFDGALVLQPTSATPHVLAFHFSTQPF